MIEYKIKLNKLPLKKVLNSNPTLIIESSIISLDHKNTYSKDQHSYQVTGSTNEFRPRQNVIVLLAVDIPIVVVVEEISQQFIALNARETLRMPPSHRIRMLGTYCYFTGIQVELTLLTLLFEIKHTRI